MSEKLLTFPNGDVLKCNNYTSRNEDITSKEVKSTSEKDIQKCKSYTSGNEENTLQEVKKVHSIYNNINYTDNIISINQSKDEIYFQIKKNIEYNEIKRDGEYNIHVVDNIIELIFFTVISEKKSFRVGKENINSDCLKESLMALKRKNVEYVIDCVSNCKDEIKNINAYLLTALYNAKNTVDIYWQQKLNREIPIMVAELEKRKII